MDIFDFKSSIFGEVKASKAINYGGQKKSGPRS